ncbi:MAG: hypothetical protein U0263_23970 [Polyangiaceae bacterium]
MAASGENGAALPARVGGTAERLAYALYAGALTLWIACVFYASMRQQISLTADAPYASAQDWSGPLDDVFIHFDFARAVARGHPFEWSEGNGYSSGGTSMLYPFVLAFGYWIGLRSLSLMIWAGVVACVSTFGLLLAARRLFRDLPRYTSYLAPPFVLCIGVLAWSLFSGMEVAFFLGIWGGALVAWDDLCRPDPAAVTERPVVAALLLGSWGALLVATRPESSVVLAVFALSAGLARYRSLGTWKSVRLVILAGLPGALVVMAQSVANRLLTGEATAAGALVKLELHHPYLSATEVWNAWKFHVEYQLRRVAEYHLSDRFGVGYIPFALALFALVPRATRRYAALLWASAVPWVLVVALNGQVRWQNERYTMPALAWVMLAAALGVAALVGNAFALGRRGRVLRAVASSAAVGLVALFAWHHLSRFRDQVWFFGRASRNIRDQHVRTGRLLRDMRPNPPHRVLVGDAGAIPYASDLPALDIIGLGGTRRLPFARATRQGVGAAIELIERLPEQERPDLFAIYPSWWGVLPLWFGQELGEVPVTGNVICGGAAKVLYRPDWSALEGSALPFSMNSREVVVDELDVADVVSEREHGYRTSVGVAHVDMKRLAHPREPHRDLFDAGRNLPEGASAEFSLRNVSGAGARVILRLAPARPARLALDVGSRRLGELDLDHTDGWVELELPWPADLGDAKPALTLRAVRGEHVLHHLWLVQRQ